MSDPLNWTDEEMLSYLKNKKIMARVKGVDTWLSRCPVGEDGNLILQWGYKDRSLDKILNSKEKEMFNKMTTVGKYG